ncbi:hypothetical protein BGX21_002842, partial [Mortierella sp. AD011]
MLAPEKISENNHNVNSVDSKCNEGLPQTRLAVVEDLHNNNVTDMESTNDSGLLENESAGGVPSGSTINSNEVSPANVSDSLGLHKAENSNVHCQIINNSQRINEHGGLGNVDNLTVTKEESASASLVHGRCANTEGQVVALENSSSGEINNQPLDLILLVGNSLRPDLFPLIDITQHDIDTIVNQVKGGPANIKDIYDLSPLQEGILFHHAMTTEGDPYLIATLMSFDNKNALDRYLVAFQKVIDRHDVLRSTFIWEHLSRPAQVVLRHAPIPITEMSLNPADGPVSEQLAERFNPHSFRIDLTQAPLIRAVIARESDDRWVLLQLMHHIIDDQYSRTQIQIEIRSILEGKVEALNPPQPFRDYIAQIRSGPCNDDHKRFFTKMLEDIDTPVLPFGLSDVNHASLDVTGSLLLPQELNDRLRGHATRTGVS